MPSWCSPSKYDTSRHHTTSVDGKFTPTFNAIRGGDLNVEVLATRIAAITVVLVGFAARVAVSGPLARPFVYFLNRDSPLVKLDPTSLKMIATRLTDRTGDADLILTNNVDGYAESSPLYDAQSRT